MRKWENGNETLSVHWIALDGIKIDVRLVGVSVGNLDWHPGLPVIFELWARGGLHEATAGNCSEFEVGPCIQSKYTSVPNCGQPAIKLTSLDSRIACILWSAVNTP